VDLVGSRRFSGARRPALQTSLRALVQGLNRDYRGALLTPLAISRGDEFQGLLHDATVLPDLIWDMDHRFQETPLRQGIGFGALDTPLGANVLELDGPVLHRARAALQAAEEGRRLGGVFSGFGADGDIILNGLARVLRRQRERMSRKQLQVLELLREGRSQVAIAEQSQLTKQAIWAHARAAGADAYIEGETAWRTALARFTGPEATR
jgi:hypothetical protein